MRRDFAVYEESGRRRRRLPDVPVFGLSRNLLAERCRRQSKKTELSSSQ